MITLTIIHNKQETEIEMNHNLTFTTFLASQHLVYGLYEISI